MVDEKKNREVGAQELLRATVKWLMKQRPLITTLLSQRTESTPTFLCHSCCQRGWIQTEISISFTYRVRTVIQQITVLCTEWQQLLSSLCLDNTAVWGCRRYCNYSKSSIKCQLKSRCYRKTLGTIWLKLKLTFPSKCNISQNKTNTAHIHYILNMCTIIQHTSMWLKQHQTLLSL